MNPIRALGRGLLSKIRYRQVKIAWGAYLAKGLKIGARVMIGAEAELVACELGNDVQVCDHCRLVNCTLDHFTKVYEACDLAGVSLGSYSFIAEGCRINDTTIGRFCSIGPQAIIGYGDHPTNWISTSPVFYSPQKQCGTSFASQAHYPEKKAIVIGNDTWIGARVFIRDGVSIGNGAIIGAGAIVVDDVPDYAIVAGCPAKIIRYRFTAEERARLIAIQWWNLDADLLKQHQSVFRQPDPEAMLRELSREPRLDG